MQLPSHATAPTAPVQSFACIFCYCSLLPLSASMQRPSDQYHAPCCFPATQDVKQAHDDTGPPNAASPQLFLAFNADGEGDVGVHLCL